MKNNILISVLIIVLSLFSMSLFGQTRSGNYINRDSTSVTNPFEFTTIIGPSAGKNMGTLSSSLPQYTSYNTIIGSSAGYNLGTGTTNYSPSYTMIGAFSGYYKRKLLNDFGTDGGDTYIGAFSGYSGFNTGGNTLIGYKSGYAMDTTNETSAIGYESGKNARLAYGSVFIGTRSGKDVRGSQNVAIGRDAGSNMKSSRNVMIGSNAGAFGIFTGNDNTFIGSDAGSGYRGNSGSSVFIGSSSGLRTSTGGYNTFIGSFAGQDNTIGNNNLFIGYISGINHKTGYGNIFIGSYTGGLAVTDTNISNSIVIGNYAKVSANNSIILGNASNNTIKVGIGNTAPQNKLEITSAAANTSGLRFTNLTSTSTPSVPNSLGLSVDANGDVILVSASSGGATQDSMLVKYVGTNKLVGLGIASPLEKLHISAGNLRVDNVLPRMYMKNTSTGTDITLAQLGTDNILKLANNAIQAEAFGGSPSIYIKNNGGNVGIGNITPNNKLEITSATTNTSGLRFTNLKATSIPSASNSLGLSVDANGDVILVPAGGGTLPQGADVWDQLTNGADYLIRNKNNKSVMIGTVAATKTSIDYKLYVEKGILAEKVKISTQANWPDYVFAKNYSLMSLKEVENFITTNNHLPEVPSAEVIAKDGLDLGKMDATLLKKVEELTLYLIEQNKKIEVLQNELSTLKAKK
jgi:hypothetical protein